MRGAQGEDASERQGMGRQGRVTRHRPVDRVFHWVMAALMFALLATSFLPVAGVQFPWVVPHWIAGVVLIPIVLFHVVRVLSRQDIRTMGVGAASIAEVTRRARPGKYNLGQRLYHNAMAALVLGGCVSGALMMVKQDTPLWKRNPYWLTDGQWGWIYVVHGLCAMVILAMVMIHIYFALRPENAFYLRSMFKGWITESEYQTQHDPQRWPRDTGVK